MRAVLFDLDCTLTDRDASIRDFAGIFRAEFHANLGLIDDDDLFSALLRADGRGYRARAEMCSELATCLPWRKRPSAHDIEHFWRGAFPQCAVASGGLYELIANLVNRGFGLGIVSNGGSNAQNVKIDALGVKPSAEIFLRALKLVGAQPAEALFVGDNPAADIVGAHEVGITAVWLRNGRDWPEDLAQPALEIDSLLYLLDLPGSALLDRLQE